MKVPRNIRVLRDTSLLHRTVKLVFLHQVSQMTRVIMTTQHRYKIHAMPIPLHSIPYGDPTFDWSEAVFLHYLQQQPLQGLTLVSPYAPLKSKISTKKQVGRSGSELRDHLMSRTADGEVWWWDTSLPLSLAENRECDELYHSGLTRHHLYNSSFLKCRDENHAGTLTLKDQVTMLLNLVCNSLLGGHEGLCCG